MGLPCVGEGLCLQLHGAQVAGQNLDHLQYEMYNTYCPQVNLQDRQIIRLGLTFFQCLLKEINIYRGEGEDLSVQLLSM